MIAIKGMEMQTDYKWIDYEDVTGEGSNTYECPYCDFILQLMEGTPEENLYNYCPRCGKKLIVKVGDINERTL